MAKAIILIASKPHCLAYPYQAIPQRIGLKLYLALQLLPLTCISKTDTLIRGNFHRSFYEQALVLEGAILAFMI